jgi:hypothetical protein
MAHVMTRRFTGRADRLPAVSPDLPSTPTTPASSPSSTTRTGPLRAMDICDGLDLELRPKNIEGTRAD